jgi:hypothetical protein
MTKASFRYRTGFWGKLILQVHVYGWDEEDGWTWYWRDATAKDITRDQTVTVNI